MFKIILQTPKGLSNVQAKFNEAIQEGGQESTILVNNAAIENAPRKFGNLKRSIHPAVNMTLGKFSGKIIQDSMVAKYGKMVEEGTGIYHEPDSRQPWVITPKNKKALAFKVGGELIIRKKVIVKGQKAQFFMKRALEDNKGKIHEKMQYKINKVIQEMEGK